MLRKFSTSVVFANDLSDHCIVGAVRNTKISRSEPRISFNWGRIKQADNVSLGIFTGELCLLCGQTRPFLPGQGERSGQAWFGSVPADLLHERNLGRKSGSDADWLRFH